MTTAFRQFRERLFEIQLGITIEEPIDGKVARCYWGASGGTPTQFPCWLNSMAEPRRIVDPTYTQEESRITMQLLVNNAQAEPERSSEIATEFWFATKAAFDADRTIGGTVLWSTVRGGDPTVPVILQHAGTAYIGVNAILDIEWIGGRA